MEEKHFGDVLLQLGARIEHIKLTADDVLLPTLETHSMMKLETTMTMRKKQIVRKYTQLNMSSLQ